MAHVWFIIKIKQEILPNIRKNLDFIPQQANKESTKNGIATHRLRKSV